MVILTDSYFLDIAGGYEATDGVTTLRGGIFYSIKPYVYDYFLILAKQRYFSVKDPVVFPTQKALDFEISKNIVPFNVGIRLKLNLDKVFGFYFEVLPGIYIVDSFEKGFLVPIIIEISLLGVLVWED